MKLNLIKPGLVIAICTLLLTACGKKAPLYLDFDSALSIKSSAKISVNSSSY